ncbi:unnamed protein product [Ostreobium quekettii]|uniref:J domain-containing protein n=1 Tax=Ostreobium quekettii TaxID=121088 RepID=A0A8S1IYW7_9CHLO|nr:unnamed protein product [Ostreobium quekettii]|eukprot:evm.model.scf_294.11 EVM.evm.TU.scf_294.11   scf_294:86361-91435(-)
MPPMDDPYKVLGTTKKASSDALQKAYNNRLREAKEAGDDARVEQIEKAHSAIMMAALSQRLKGGSVDRDVRFADKAVYLPWRPRLAVAPLNLLMADAAIHLVLLCWAVVLSTTAATQPLIASAVACCAINYLKLERMFPSGGGMLFGSSSEERGQGAKNLWRAALLALMGTTVGVVFLYTLPDFVADQILGKKLPLWFYESQNLLLNLGGITVNSLFSAFCR